MFNTAGIIFEKNSIGFLKTLQKKGVENEVSTTYAKLIRSFNKNFNNFYENKNTRIDDIRKMISFIKQIENFLIKNFENIDREVLYEKTNLYKQANEIENLLEKLKK